MSNNTLQLFLFFLKTGKWNELVERFYTRDTKLSIAGNVPVAGVFDELISIMSPNGEVSQNMVTDVVQDGTSVSFKLYRVIKRLDHHIDMMEHQITQDWSNNKIQEHTHIIIHF